MSAYESKLRQEKKVELSRKVSLTVVDEIWKKSLTVNGADEFVDYLMTITDEEAIEEFFNKCHDEGGRFCGGPGGKGGPGTRRPAPVDYIKTRVKTAKGTHKGKESSESVNRVTTGAVRRVLGLIVPTSTAYGSVKIKKLSKTNLNGFTDKDLGTVKKALMTDQRRYNLMHTSGWASVAIHTAAGAALGAQKGSIGGPAGAALGAAQGALANAVLIGLARWKTKRIPGQISRIDRELKARESGGGSLSSEDVIEFATEEGAFPTLAQEIAQAKKDIEAGSGPKSPTKPSADELSELGKMIDALEVDAEEGITAEIIKSLKESLAAVSAGNK